MHSHCYVAVNTIILAGLVATTAMAQDEGASAISLRKDGFPTGNTTPEGAATDLVRAFIQRDYQLFNEARYTRACEGRNDPPNYYVAFRRHTVFSTASGIFGDDELPDRLRRISQVFAARPLPARTEQEALGWQSYFMMYGLQERMFVDVIVSDHGGRNYLHRTPVVKSENGRWYAEPKLNPVRKIDELLIEQTSSTTDFAAAYEPVPHDAK